LDEPPLRTAQQPRRPDFFGILFHDHLEAKPWMTSGSMENQYWNPEKIPTEEFQGLKVNAVDKIGRRRIVPNASE
jgi:hypothetical protein